MRGHSTMGCGIYSISNLATGKMYIGSAVNFEERWRIHRVQLGCGKHHSKHLQASWSKYGPDVFIFKKLLICAKEHLIMYEQIMIDAFCAANRNHGYNSRPTADSMLGYRHTSGARAKMSVARKGQVFSAETRALWSKNRTGRKMPDWFPEFTRKHKTGSKHTAATKAVISAKGLGRPVSLFTREKKAKLTFEQVQTIKTRVSAGATQAQLAAEFCLNQSSISLIVSGKRWANLPPTNQENHHG